MGAANYGATTAKAALELLGVLDNRNVRGPLVPLTDDEVAALRGSLHAAGDQLASMIDAWARGDHAEALRIHTSLLPAFDAVMGVPNYGATTAKAALELLGVLDNRRVRGPLVALDDDEVTALRAGLAAAGLL